MEVQLWVFLSWLGAINMVFAEVLGVAVTSGVNSISTLTAPPHTPFNDSVTDSATGKYSEPTNLGAVNIFGDIRSAPSTGLLYQKQADVTSMTTIHTLRIITILTVTETAAVSVLNDSSTSVASQETVFRSCVVKTKTTEMGNKTTFFKEADCPSPIIVALTDPSATGGPKTANSTEPTSATESTDTAAMTDTTSSSSKMRFTSVVTSFTTAPPTTVIATPHHSASFSTGGWATVSMPSEPTNAATITSSPPASFGAMMTLFIAIGLAAFVL